MLNVNRIVHSTRAEGPGLRCCVWTQGCSIHCEGCFAHDKWDFTPRWLVSPADILDSVLPTEEGLTVLGGEPFDQAEPLAELLCSAQQRGLSTVVFTGYTLEVLRARRNVDIDRALAHIDVLIDGPYVDKQAQNSRPLVGSSNQRFLFLTDRYTAADFESNRLEIRIGTNGSIGINGMADSATLQSIHQL